MPAYAVPPRAASNPLLAPPLAADATVDVCIVGASLAAMMAAYLVAKSGRRVMVVDEGPIGGLHGVVEAAPMASAVDVPYREVREQHGADRAIATAQARAAAIDALEAMVRREAIACDFERLDGLRLAAPGEPQEAVEQEAAAARSAGVRGAEVAVLAGERLAVRYPAQAQFHPRKFLGGLARAITRVGGRLHSATRAPSLAHAQGAAHVQANGHRVRAAVLVTPGAPPRPVAAAQACPVLGLRLPRGSAAHALYFEPGAEGLRTARLRAFGGGAGELLLACGGAGIEALEAWARHHFPRAGEVVQRFEGEVVPTTDLLALRGEAAGDEDAVYVSTAGWGDPLTRATLAALAIRDFIDGARLPWGELYSTRGVNVAGGRQ